MIEIARSKGSVSRANVGVSRREERLGGADRRRRWLQEEDAAGRPSQRTDGVMSMMPTSRLHSTQCGLVVGPLAGSDVCEASISLVKMIAWVDLTLNGHWRGAVIRAVTSTPRGDHSIAERV